MANPTLLTQPLAANGDKNVIPNTTAVQGAFSQDKGFPAECSLPLGAGGVAPSRQDFNGAFNLLSALMYYAQKGYTWHWESTQSYFKGCAVIDETNGIIYRCKNDVAAGGSAPSTDATNWEPAFDGRFLPLSGGAMTGETVTIHGESNSSQISINSAPSYQNGGRMLVFGKDHASFPGCFVLQGHDGVVYKSLIGSPDGSLTWNASGHNVEIKDMAFPSATSISCGITTSGEIFTAPANGYVAIRMLANTVGQIYVVLENGAIISADHMYLNSAVSYTLSTIIPVRKGNSIKALWSGGDLRYCSFIYAEGEV